MSEDSETDSDCALVTFTVANARPVRSKTLFALVDVEMQIGGGGFMILGVQARNLPGGGTSCICRLTRMRTAHGARRSDSPANCATRSRMPCWYF